MSRKNLCESIRDIRNACVFNLGKHFTIFLKEIFKIILIGIEVTLLFIVSFKKQLSLVKTDTEFSFCPRRKRSGRYIKS